MTRLVVVGRYDEKSVGSCFFCFAGQRDRFVGRVRASASIDRHFAASRFYGGANDFDVLGFIEGGGLASRADGDEAIYAAIELVGDELFQVGISDFATLHRCCQRGKNT